MEPGLRPHWLEAASQKIDTYTPAFLFFSGTLFFFFFSFPGLFVELRWSGHVPRHTSFVKKKKTKPKLFYFFFYIARVHTSVWKRRFFGAATAVVSCFWRRRERWMRRALLGGSPLRVVWRSVAGSERPSERTSLNVTGTTTCLLSTWLSESLACWLVAHVTSNAFCLGQLLWTGKKTRREAHLLLRLMASPQSAAISIFRIDERDMCGTRASLPWNVIFPETTLRFYFPSFLRLSSRLSATF